MSSVDSEVVSEVLDRDDGCLLCSEDPDDVSELHLHHRNEKQNGGTDDPENLIALCSRCHKHHHRSGIADTDLESIDRDTFDCELTPVDEHIIAALNQAETRDVGTIVEKTGATETHVRARLTYLWYHDVVDRSTDGEWGRPRAVSDSARDTFPEKSYLAFLMGRNETLRRLTDAGCELDALAEGLNLGTGTIRRGLNKVKARQPPINQSWQQCRTSEIDPGALHGGSPALTEVDLWASPPDSDKQAAADAPTEARASSAEDMAGLFREIANVLETEPDEQPTEAEDQQ